MTSVPATPAPHDASTDVVVFGDWHATAGWATQAIAQVAAATPARHWYQVGDFGLWSVRAGTAKRSYLDAVQASLAAQGAQLYVVLGNHENYDLIEQFQHDDDGWGMLPAWDRIHYAPRAHVWTHPGTELMFAALGGAGSVDLRRRKLGHTWWMAEEITDADVAGLLGLLPPERIDVFLSHEAPAGVTVIPGERVNGIADEAVIAYCARQRERLQRAFAAARPHWAFHGHWHLFHTARLTTETPAGTSFETEVVGLDRDGETGNAAILSCRLDNLALPLNIARDGNTRPGAAVTAPG
ncbi:MAG: phage Thibault [Actinomycetota bacterium]